MNKLLALLFLLCLSGCAKKPVQKKPLLSGHDELIARISFLPDTPFFAEVEQFSEDPSCRYNVIIRYRYQTDIESVYSFYMKEMERHGWHMLMRVDAQDKVMTFTRPNLVAVIEIRPEEQKYSIALGRKVEI